jgi:hypothetical protein
MQMDSWGGRLQHCNSKGNLGMGREGGGGLLLSCKLCSASGWQTFTAVFQQSTNENVGSALTSFPLISTPTFARCARFSRTYARAHAHR